MRFMFLRWYSCISRLFPVAAVLKFKFFYYRATDARSQSYNTPNIIIKLFLCLIHRVTSDDMVFITKRLHQKVKLSYYYLHFLAFFSRIILPPVQFWSTWFSDIFAYFKAHDLQIYLLIPGHVIYGRIRPIFLSSDVWEKSSVASDFCQNFVNFVGFSLIFRLFCRISDFTPP